MISINIVQHSKIKITCFLDFFSLECFCFQTILLTRESFDTLPIITVHASWIIKKIIESHVPSVKISVEEHKFVKSKNSTVWHSSRRTEGILVSGNSKGGFGTGRWTESLNRYKNSDLIVFIYFTLLYYLALILHRHLYTRLSYFAQALACIFISRDASPSYYVTTL